MSASQQAMRGIENAIRGARAGGTYEKEIAWHSRV
jgi:hypothetical protein